MDIISLTTIPRRIDKIKPCIDSLVRQDMIIYLWLADDYIRADGKIGDIPEFLKHPNIRIRFVEDHGSITKLYPALFLEDVDRIITADDDIVYPDDWAKNLLDASTFYPDSALCYRGRTLLRQGGKMLPYNQSKLFKGADYKKVHLVTGVWGCLYRRSFFDDDFFKYRQYDYMSRVDDIWISGYLEEKNITKRCIPRVNIKNAKDERGKRIYQINALFAKNRKSSYNDDAIKLFRWQNL
jgi:hypothetical protein